MTLTRFLKNRRDKTQQTEKCKVIRQYLSP